MVLSVYQALNGKAPGHAEFEAYRAQAAGSGAAFLQAMATQSQGLSHGALARQSLQNLHVTPCTVAPATYTALVGALEQLFAAYDTNSRAAILLNLANILMGLKSDANYGTAANTFAAQLDANYTYSSKLANTAAAALNVSDAPGSSGTLVLRAWNPDGSAASIDDHVNATRYVNGRWSLYGNLGAFPMGVPPATAQCGSNIQVKNVEGLNQVAVTVPANQRLYYTALWKAPVIGTVFMRADSAGDGLLVAASQNLVVELPYDFALSEFQQAQRQAAGVALSTEAASLMQQATTAVAAAKGAATPQARALAAYTALSYVMPLKERLVLDASNKAIAATGARADFDMNYEGFGSWTDTRFLSGYTRAKEAGFGSVLTSVDWNAVSPTQGSYNFTALDYQVDQAQKLGFKLALNVNGNIGALPTWAKALGFEALKALYYENARQVVAHFGTKVAWYYPAAELELALDGHTLAQVAQLVRQSLAGARAAAPDKPYGVYVSASAYVGYQMNLAANPTYVSGLDLLSYLSGNDIRFDFVGLEMQYATTFAPIDLQRFQEVVQDVYKVAKVPIYMGETGYSSKTEDYGMPASFFWHGGLTQQAQAEWADGSLRLLYALPYVKGYYWVHLDPDNNDYGSDYLSTLIGTGLVRADGSAKSAYTAFKSFNDQVRAIGRSAAGPWRATQ